MVGSDPGPLEDAIPDPFTTGTVYLYRDNLVRRRAKATRRPGGTGQLASLQLPGGHVPGHALTRRVEDRAREACGADHELRPVVERDRRQVFGELLVPSVQERVALRDVELPRRRVERRCRLAIAVVAVVLVAPARVEAVTRDLRVRATPVGEHDQVPVARGKRASEEGPGGLEPRHEIDADALELPVDELEGERPPLVPGRREEAA